MLDMCPFLNDEQPRCGCQPTLKDLDRALEFCAFDHRRCPVYVECTRHEAQLHKRKRVDCIVAG